MSEEKMMPEWVENLFETIASNIEFKGLSGLEGRYSKPDETGWGVHLLEIAPALEELDEAGPNDGEQIYGIFHSVDLLEIQKALDEVNGLSFGFENDGTPCITIDGRSGEQEIVVLIYGVPT